VRILGRRPFQRRTWVTRVFLDYFVYAVSFKTVCGSRSNGRSRTSTGTEGTSTWPPPERRRARFRGSVPFAFYEHVCGTVQRMVSPAVSGGRPAVGLRTLAGMSVYRRVPSWRGDGRPGTCCKWTLTFCARAYERKREICPNGATTTARGRGGRRRPSRSSGRNVRSRGTCRRLAGRRATDFASWPTGRGPRSVGRKADCPTSRRDRTTKSNLYVSSIPPSFRVGENSGIPSFYSWTNNRFQPTRKLWVVERVRTS